MPNARLFSIISTSKQSREVPSAMYDPQHLTAIWAICNNPRRLDQKQGSLAQPNIPPLMTKSGPIPNATHPRKQPAFCP